MKWRSHLKCCNYDCQSGCSDAGHDHDAVQGLLCEFIQERSAACARCSLS